MKRSRRTHHKTENKMHFEDAFWSADYITGIREFLSVLDARLLETQRSLDGFRGYAELIDASEQKLVQINNLKPVKHHWEADSLTVTKFKHDKEFVSLDQFQGALDQEWKDARVSTQQLSVQISSNAILRLQQFVEDYKEYIRHSKADLQFQYNQYVKVTQSVVTIEKRLVSKIATMENVHGSTKPAEPIPPSLAPKQSEQGDDEKEDDIFRFPMTIGTTTLQCLGNLSDLLSTMMSEVRLRKRMIPLPGVNNDYFSSEDFVFWVKQTLNNEDTRVKIEKFGQDMLGLGLIHNWNRLGSTLFVSDSGYYEFTDLARFTAKFDPQAKEEKEIPPVVSTPSQPHQPSSGIWSNLKSTFVQPTDLETLKKDVHELNSKYTNEILCVSSEKAKLEDLIKKTTRKAEIFEKNKIELVTALNSFLVSQLVKEHEERLATLKKLQDLSFSDSTVGLDLLQTMTNTNGGWYWPQNDVKFINHIVANHSIELFGVDLINLDLDLKSTDLKTRSVPVFIKLSLESLNDIEDVKCLWVQDLDMTDANETKNKVFQKLICLGGDDLVAEVTNLVNWIFETSKPASIVNFLKLWLLELPDSVVPFTCYDSLIKHYSAPDDEKSSIITILGSIPRQNLATLLFIAEHVVSKVEADSLLNLEQFPFYHLLLRPSVKTNYASIDDSYILSYFTEDLYNKELIDELFTKLEELESHHDERTHNNVEKSIASVKVERSKTPAIKTTTPSSPGMELTSDGLRVFKTRSPAPSPNHSPKAGRSRTNSNLTPHRLSMGNSSNLLRPSDNLSKRSSLIVQSADNDETDTQATEISL